MFLKTIFGFDYIPFCIFITIIYTTLSFEVDSKEFKHRVENDTSDIATLNSANKKYLVYKNSNKKECYLEEDESKNESPPNEKNSRTLFVSLANIDETHQLFKELGDDVINFCKDYSIRVLEEQPPLYKKNSGNKENGELKRVRRQTNNRKPNYRGQTQTQFVSFNKGTTGDKAGSAEAIAEPDRSQARVSGTVGMGQAQSQSGNSDSCLECFTMEEKGKRIYPNADGQQLQNGYRTVAHPVEVSSPSTAIYPGGVSSISPDYISNSGSNFPAVIYPSNTSYSLPPSGVYSPFSSQGTPIYTSGQTYPASQDRIQPFQTSPSTQVGQQYPRESTAVHYPTGKTYYDGQTLYPGRAEQYDRTQYLAPSEHRAQVYPTGQENIYHSIQSIPKEQSVPVSSNGQTYSEKQATGKQAFGSQIMWDMPISSKPISGGGQQQPPTHTYFTGQIPTSRQTHYTGGQGSQISSEQTHPLAQVPSSGQAQYPGSPVQVPSEIPTQYSSSQHAPIPLEHIYAPVQLPPGVQMQYPGGAIQKPLSGQAYYPGSQSTQIPFRQVQYNTDLNVAQIPSSGQANLPVQMPSSGQAPYSGSQIPSEQIYYPVHMPSGGQVQYPPGQTVTQVPSGDTYPSVLVPSSGQIPHPGVQSTYIPSQQTYSPVQMPSGGQVQYPSSQSTPQVSSGQMYTPTQVSMGGLYPGSQNAQISSGQTYLPVQITSSRQEPYSGAQSTYIPSQHTYSPIQVPPGGQGQYPVSQSATQLSSGQRYPPVQILSSEQARYPGGTYQTPLGGYAQSPDKISAEIAPGQIYSVPSGSQTQYPSGVYSAGTQYPAGQYSSQTYLNNQSYPTGTPTYPSGQSYPAGPIFAGRGTGTTDLQITGGSKGVDMSQGSVITPVDTESGDAQSLSSINIEGNETKAAASSQGKTRSGIAQAQVSGTYTGSFLAQAQTGDNEKGAESMIFGNTTGAVSSSQGRAGKSQSQSQMRYNYDNGATIAEAQGNGDNYKTNSQIQAGIAGGLADSQSSGSGSTASQAQIGFLPYDESRQPLKSLFEGGGSASSQSGSLSGQSQTQLQGSFQDGVSYTGAAQSSSGRNVQNYTRPNFNSSFLSFPKGNTSLFQRKNQNTNYTGIGDNNRKPQSPQNKLDAGGTLYGESTKYPKISDTTTSTAHNEVIKSTVPLQTGTKPDTAHQVVEIESNTTPIYYGENSVNFEDDDLLPSETKINDASTNEGYKKQSIQNDYIEPNSFAKNNKNNRLTQAQGTFIKSDQHDAIIIQDSSNKLKNGGILKPGEIIPSIDKYRIPSGFRGRIISVAGDKTEANASPGGQAQTQTVFLKPGSGKVVVYDKSKPQDSELYSVQNDSQQSKFKEANNKRYNTQNPYDSYVTVTKSETGEIDNGEKKYSHTYYTKSSTCGYFTFSCTMIQGTAGRTKICKPNPPTYSDGTPC